MESSSTSSKVAQFHLGMSEDGQRCLMVFIDEKQNAMECVADFGEFTAFISSLCDAANEMAKRQGTESESPTVQGSVVQSGASVDGQSKTIQCRPIDVSSAAFQVHPGDGSVMGALVSNAGEVVGVRMRPDVACQVTRDLLMATPASRA